MSEFEEKLSAILGDPTAMAQIMSLAQELGGGSGAASTAPPAAPPAGSDGAADLGALLSSFGEPDPQLLQKGAQLLSRLSGSEDERAALLLSLKPFLKEERRVKVDRAVRIARLSRVLRVAFTLLRGKEEEDV